jgi:hypothetical protein
MKGSTSVLPPATSLVAFLACLFLAQCAHRSETHSAALSKPSDSDWYLAHTHPPTFYPTGFVPTKSGFKEVTEHYLAEQAAKFYIPTGPAQQHYQLQVAALQDASFKEQREARQSGTRYPPPDKQVISWVAKRARVDLTKHNGASEVAGQTALTVLVRLPITAFAVALAMMTGGGVDMSDDMDGLWSD